MLKIVDIYKDESSYGTVVEPVTLTEAKAWLLVDYTDDDTLITSIITQSRHRVEDFCHISIVPRSIFLTAIVDGFECDYSGISRWDRAFFGVTSRNNAWSELPYGPVSSVTSVTTVDLGTTTILTNNTDYFLRGQAFKEIKIESESEQILIQYLTPYYCPASLKVAILAEIAFSYENRGSSVNRYAQQNVGISERAEALANPFKRIWV